MKWNKENSQFLNTKFPVSVKKDTLESVRRLSSLSLKDTLVRPGGKDTMESRIRSKVLTAQKEVVRYINKHVPYGTISAGYDYGFLPYTINMASPAHAYRTEGQTGLSIFGLPLDVMWFYSSQKNLIGLNNYFRISFNAEHYKSQLNSDLEGKREACANQLSSLTAQRQSLLQKMAYADYLSSVIPDKWPTEAPQKPKTALLPAQGLMPDSTAIADSLKRYLPKDSSSRKETTLEKVKQYRQRSDSVRQAYDVYHKQYVAIDDSIRTLQKRIAELEHLSGGNSAQGRIRHPYFSKMQDLLNGIRKFEIGLCYPNASTFLVSNIPVRGVHIEFEQRNKYLAFTYGTTVSTLLYNNKSPEGFLQNVRNSYNYFDFRNVSSGRKILSAKFGIGSKEGNHLFGGFLIGKGQSDYQTSYSGDYAYQVQESNLVLELDGRLKLAKHTRLDLALGRSSLKDENLSYELIKSAIGEIFSDYRSNALLTTLTTQVPATKTGLTFTLRWVDPFFKSFGVGFIRSDNMRYEVKLNQPLTSKLRYTVAFRYETDNLLELANYKNRFYSINNTLSYKIKRGLMLRLSYVPLFRSLESENYRQESLSSISTGVITFSPRSRSASYQFNLLYNYYQVNTDTAPVNFQNIAYFHQIGFKNRLRTRLNLSWYKNTLKDSLNNNVVVGMIDLGYELKNGSSFTVAGKCAYKLSGQVYPGFVIKVSLKLVSRLFWENQVEKFIVGDLFNGYDYENLQRFPYYCSTRLIYNF